MLRKWIILSFSFVALLVGGLAYGFTSVAGASSEEAEKTEASFVCPVTGEDLPCPNCCPLNR